MGIKTKEPKSRDYKDMTMNIESKGFIIFLVLASFLVKHLVAK